ncbi:hypothetical protein [Anabaena sp. 4-3]|uniref:hypothetical protein n=1 Tax=Anabaena sp. 4-3 TaxID=1811979 RepID=UPI000835C6A8|nr:hypothetical protein [Anabaena sp. 4-3]
MNDSFISLSLQIPQGDRLEIQVKECQYFFNLNDNIVQQIQQAKATGKNLYIPPSLLIPLCYYTCISYNPISIQFHYSEAETLTHAAAEKRDNQHLNHPKKITWLPVFYILLLFNIVNFIFNREIRQQVSLQTEFTFNSYYQEEIVLQSNIFLHGDIFHKIQHNFLNTNPNCARVISAHYWLTEEILSYFRKNLNILVWEIASLVPAGFLAYHLHSGHWFSSIATWIGATLGIACSRPLLVSFLQRFTPIQAKNLNDWAWGVISTISSMIVSGFQGLSNINPFLMLFISLLTPEIVKPILRFIWPQVGKLTIRLLSFLPF